MKKLNKKGFTLVELLAVIVILAIIMVITIPTVLSSMGNARQSAFESAVATVEEYIEKNVQICEAGLSEFTGEFDKQILGENCKFIDTDDAKKTLVINAGYDSTDIDVTAVYISPTGAAKISAKPGSGEFNGASSVNNIPAVEETTGGGETTGGEGTGTEGE